MSDSLGRQTALVRPLGQGVLVHSAQYQDVLNIRHIFLGEVKVVKSGPKAGTKYSGGFHSRYSIMPALQRIREADSLAFAADAATNKWGAYRKYVSIMDPGGGGWIDNIPYSTFFPDDWTHVRVMNEILSAFDNMTSSAGDKWYGVSHSGMPIVGIFDQVTGKIKTAYPNIVFPPPP